MDSRPALAVAVLGVMMLLQAFPVARAQQGGDGDSEVWGGRDISMQTNASGAAIEFDCGHGSIAQPIKPDAHGDFSVAGTYTPETGGPVRKDNPPGDLAATYKGTISGDTMHLEVLLSDNTHQPPPFTLTRGSPGRVVKCR